MKPVLVSTWCEPGQKYFQQFMETARKHGLEPQNADPKVWAGTSWQDKEWFRKSEAQCRFVRDHKNEFTHFAFSDAFDILFAAGWEEITRKYESYSSPIVFAAECYPWPHTEQAKLYPESPLRCRFLNAGFWMGEAEAALKMLQEFEVEAAKRTICDQGIAVSAYLSKRHPIELDRRCALCHCCNLDSMSFLDFTLGRWRNTETNETPCLFHGNGNSPIHTLLPRL